MHRRRAIEIKYLQGQPAGANALAACRARAAEKWSICPRGPQPSSNHAAAAAAVWLNGYEWPIKKMFGTAIKMNHLLLKYILHARKHDRSVVRSLWLLTVNCNVFNLAAMGQTSGAMNFSLPQNGKFLVCASVWTPNFDYDRRGNEDQPCMTEHVIEGNVKITVRQRKSTPKWQEN